MGQTAFDYFRTQAKQGIPLETAEKNGGLLGQLLAPESRRIAYQAGLRESAARGMMEEKKEIRYYRVQGGPESNAKRSQYRVTINQDGTISIPNKNADLNVSAYELDHALYFRDAKRPGGEIIEFEVPLYLDELIRGNSIQQHGYRSSPFNQDGMAPKLVDPTTPGTSYELPASPWLDWLEEYAHSAKRVE